MSVMELARQERQELLELLVSLSEDQWRAPSLCEGWSVQDVVAHVLSYEELRPRRLLKRFAQGLFHPDRVNAVGVCEYRSRTPDELIDLLRRHLSPTGLTAGMGGAIALTDGMIHQQDIRRPLRLPREIPAERLRPALRTALFSPILRGVVRVRGVRLVATDMEWTFGGGPEVRGAAEALLMIIAGRRGVVAELSGTGQPTIAPRLDG